MALVVEEGRWRRLFEPRLYALEVTVVAGLVRLVGIAREPLHIDEARQVAAYAGGLGDAFKASWQQNQPPLDHLLGWVTSRLLGESAFAYRLPALVAGTGTIALLYYLIHKRSGPYVALFGSAFLALAPLHLAYSQYARPYALPLFVLAWCLWSIDRHLTHGGPLSLVGVSFSALLLPWTRAVEGSAGLVGAFGFAILALKTVPERIRVRLVLTALGTGVMSAALVIPQLLSEAGGFVRSNPLSLGQLWGTAESALALMYRTTGPLGVGLAGGGILVIAAGLGVRHRLPAAADLMAAFLITAALSTWAIVYRSNIPLFDRYGVFQLPIIAIGFALVIEAMLPMRRQKVTGVILTMFVALTLAFSGWGSAARTVELENPAFGPAAEAIAVAGVDPTAVVFHQSRDLNAYRAGYPSVPRLPGNPQGSFRSTPWVARDPADMTDSGTITLIWLPPVRADYTIDRELDLVPPNLNGYVRVDLAGGTGSVYFAASSASTSPSGALAAIADQDSTTGRVWALLAGASLLQASGDAAGAEILISRACDVVAGEVLIDMGAVFGLWGAPSPTLRELIASGGLPAHACD